MISCKRIFSRCQDGYMVKLCKKEDGEVKKGGCYGGGSLLFLSSPPVIVPLSLFLFS